MQRQTMALVLAAAAAFTLHLQTAGAQGAPTTVTVTGVPAGSLLEIALNGGKVAETANVTDSVATPITIGSDTRQRVTVWVDRCIDNRTVRVQLVIDGQPEPPKDERCDRSLAGWFWSDERQVRIDAEAGTVVDQSAMSLRTKALIGAAGGAGAIALATLTGGSDSGTTQQTQTPSTPTSPSTPNPPSPPSTPFSPAGNYQASSTVKSDPDEHVAFVNLLNFLSLVATVNSPLTISGQAGSNWVTVSGEYDETTNRFVLTGNGTVAGRPNVSVRFEGTITTSGALSGDYTMGAGGELPGGRPIVYAITGQKQ